MLSNQQHELKLDIDQRYHGAIVGQKGVTIKEIETKTATRISMPKSASEGTKIVIQGKSKDSVVAAADLIRKTVEKQRERDQDRAKAQAAQHNRTEKLYDKLHHESDTHDKKRAEYFQKAEAAFAEGNKEDAAKYREKVKRIEKQRIISHLAKNETKEIAETERRANEKLFKDRNSKNDDLVIDLHGVHTDFALEMLQKRIAKLKGKGKSLTVITGAGNHSGAGGAKIKPLVKSFLSSKGIQYTEETSSGKSEGSIVAKL